MLKAVVNDAILSVDDWKRLVQSFSQCWRFLGFVHNASGLCISHVPPPISAQTSKTERLRTNPERKTKVRLHTDHGQYDVFVDNLRDTLKKEYGALPLGCKMRLVPRPSIGLLQAMQCRYYSRKNKRTWATDAASEQAPIIFALQVQSDAPSVVKECLHAWDDGVALDLSLIHISEPTRPY